MARYKQQDENIVQVLQSEIKRLHRRVVHLENQMNPTAPVFNLGSIPADLQDGQFFIGSDNSWCFHRGGINYRFDFQVKSSINVGAVNAHTGGSQNISISGLLVNDYVALGGTDSSANYLVVRTEHICTSAGQIALHYFNADAANQNPPAFNALFIIFHRA